MYNISLWLLIFLVTFRFEVPRINRRIFNIKATITTINGFNKCSLPFWIVWSQNANKDNPLCCDLHAGNPGTAQFFLALNDYIRMQQELEENCALIELAHAQQYITVRRHSWLSFPCIVYDISNYIICLVVWMSASSPS